MLLPILAALALQQGGVPSRPDSTAVDTIPGRPAAVHADSAAADSARQARRRRRPPRSIPLTPELERTAFVDPAARTLLHRAREARLLQDTSLVAYDATAYQRVSVGLGVRRLARDRLLFRQEEAVRVQWHRDRGAMAEVLGFRRAVPIGGDDVDVGMGGDVPIPYVPGQESLWIGTTVAKVELDDREPVHPLVPGAEAYYRYATGDSLSLRLPDGRTIRLRELRVRPREPRWNLFVGSLWFDVDNAQLVRAVYRLATPIEIWQVAAEDDDPDDDDVPRLVRTLLNPMRATLRAVTVEYGLEGGRFWLPRLQSLEAEAEVAFMRVPVRFEQSFRYASVNGTVEVPEPPAQADSARASITFSLTVGGDERRAGDSLRTGRDSLRAAREAECARTGYRTSHTRRLDGSVPVTVRIPCDTVALANSPALPGSIYDPKEELFGDDLRDLLVREALALGAQAGWAPQLPVVRWGVGDGMLRYNRVEGLAPAVRVDQQLGAGYAASAIARLGFADLEPTGELSLARDDGRRQLRGTAYRRLVAANDWGDPLGFGASLQALLFGRDDGLYYRAWGAELSGDASAMLADGGGRLTWRLFAERQGEAERETNFSVARWFNGNDFPPNILAEEMTVLGFGWRYVRTFGFDPNRLRTFLVLRGEGGTADAAFARGLADVTVTHPIGRRLEGALTLSAGSSTGRVPVQRLFYLGGPWSVRGLRAGTAAGDAFWLARGELAYGSIAARPVLFYDVGWAGPRGDWRHPGTPLSGAGIGMSVLDGLLRVDLSRGIQPEQRTRLDVYLEGRF